MSSNIKQQIKNLTNADSEVSKNVSNYTVKINSENRRLEEARNDKLVADCVQQISRYFSEVSQIIDRLKTLQGKITLDAPYRLTTYLSAEPDACTSQNFLDVYQKAAKSFAEATRDVLRVSDIRDLSGAAAAKALEKMGRAYASIKHIHANSKQLASELETAKIEKQAAIHLAAIADLTAELEKYRAESRKRLQGLADELDEAVRDAEAHMSECRLTDSESFVEDFHADYSLCVGKATENGAPEARVELGNISYNKVISLAGPARIPGYEEGRSSNIIIDTSASSSTADRFAENLILRYLTSYPSAFKKVVAIHNQAGSPLLSVMSQVYNCGDQAEFAFHKSIPAVVNHADEIEDVLSMLDEKINSNYSILGISEEQSIYSYNEHQSDNAEPITLLVIKDFPSGFSRGNSLELFKRIYEHGNRAGILTLVLWDSSKVDSEYGEGAKAVEMIRNMPAAYKLVEGEDHALTGNVSMLPLERGDGFNMAKYFKNIKEILSSGNKPIDVFDIQPRESFETSERRKAFSEHITVPIGKSGGKILSLDLNSLGKSHVVVNGNPGSGKTAFLHTLLLGAANNYSPEELEIFLFDFKDGAGFSMYKRKQLPHIKFIALENKIEDAIDILSYITEIMSERNRLISSIEGSNSLKGYNRAIATGNYPDKKKIPRSFIVIDEYQALLMNEKCVAALEEIARQGRSAGMSLILVSQDVPTDSSFQRIKQLIDHRFAFRGSADNIDRLISSAGKRASELELQKGLCFYEANDGIIRLMRSAFAGDDAVLSANIDKIVEKHKDYTCTMQVAGKPEPLVVRDISSVPMPSDKILSNDYLNKGACHFTLGRYSITNNPVEYISNEDNPLLVVVGNYIKAKQIATSLVCGMLRVLNAVENPGGRILVVDLCEQRRLVNQPTPLLDIIKKKNLLEDEGECDVFGAVDFYDADAFSEVIDFLEELCNERCNDKSLAIDPVQVVILGAASYNGSERLIDKLKTLIINAKKSDVYFTLQIDSFDCAFAKSMFGMRGIALKDLVLLSENEGEPVTSMDIRAALSNISGLVGNKTASEYIKSLEKAPLDPAYSFIVDDGNISKYSHFIYEGDWVDSLVNELKK